MLRSGSGCFTVALPVCILSALAVLTAAGCTEPFTSIPETNDNHGDFVPPAGESETIINEAPDEPWDDGDDAAEPDESADSADDVDVDDDLPPSDEETAVDDGEDDVPVAQLPAEEPPSDDPTVTGASVDEGEGDDAPPSSNGGGDPGPAPPPPPPPAPPPSEPPPPDTSEPDPPPADEGSGGDPADEGGSDEPPPPADDPPWNDYCATQADWNAAWVVVEAEVLTLVNQHRAAGADCGSAGSFGTAAPLTMNSALQCAARNHSLDMGVNGYFSHTSPDGQGPGDRIALAGYSFSTWGENIAWGYSTPAAVVAGWMSSPGHCANIMRPQFTETGVGYYAGNLWTQTFGRP